MAFEFDIGSARDITSENDFWAVTAVACHEPTTGFNLLFTDDLDPDQIGPPGGDPPVQSGGLLWSVQYGFSEGTLRNNLFIIFCEVVREDSIFDMEHVFTHELGHTGRGFSVLHPSGSNIMNPEYTAQVDNFNAKDISTFRSITKW
jgi:hypothetical protein